VNRRAFCLRLLALFLFTPVGLAAPGAGAAPHPVLPKHADILFLGDSITASSPYLTVLQLLLATREPGLGVLVHNGGLNGDTAAKGLARLGSELADRNFTAVVIGFGMNDVQRFTYRDAAATALTPGQARAASRCVESVERIAAKLKERGIEPILMSPPLFDDMALGLSGERAFGVNRGLGQVRDGLVRMAEAQRLRWIDLLVPGMELTANRHRTQPGFTLTTDRVHPNRIGSALIALQVAVEFGIIDQAPLGETRFVAGQPTHVRAAKVEMRSGSGPGRFEFVLRPQRLPVPPDVIDVESWPLFGFPHANRFVVAVEGLAAGTYALAIEGQPEIRADHKAWSQGVDLAAREGWPMLAAARRLSDLVAERSELVRDRLRPVQLIDWIVQSRHRLAERPTLEQVKELLPRTRLSASWEIDAARRYEAERLREAATRARVAEIESLLRTSAPLPEIRCRFAPVP